MPIQQSNSSNGKASTRTAGVAACLAVVALTQSGCSDTRTAYAAYVACDADIAAATKPKSIVSCFTEDWRTLFRRQAANNNDWVERFKESRPRISRLHREELIDDNEESILAIVGHSRTGQPVALNVVMRREAGRWRIDFEEALAKGATSSSERPVRVSLRPAEGPDWYPGELFGRAGRRSDGMCGLNISHVFQFPNLGIIVDCKRLATTGTYQLDEFAPDSAVNPDSRPVTFWDDEHYWRNVESGELTITAVDDGLISGEFRFETANPSNRLSIAGTFSNLPFEPGG